MWCKHHLSSILPWHINSLLVTYVEAQCWVLKTNSVLIFKSVKNCEWPIKVLFHRMTSILSQWTWEMLTNDSCIIIPWLTVMAVKCHSKFVLLTLGSMIATLTKGSVWLCFKFLVVSAVFWVSSRDVVAWWPLEKSSRCVTGCIIPARVPGGYWPVRGGMPLHT